MRFAHWEAGATIPERVNVADAHGMMTVPSVHIVTIHPDIAGLIVSTPRARAQRGTNVIARENAHKQIHRQVCPHGGLSISASNPVR